MMAGSKLLLRIYRRSGGSYLSWNYLRIQFGLGNKQRVDKVEFLWPTGKTEIVTGLAGDHLYYVKEGEGVVPAEDTRPAPRK